MGSENVNTLGVESVFVLNVWVVDQEFVPFGEGEDFVGEFLAVLVDGVGR